MATLTQILDGEVAQWRSRAFADSTKSAYTSQLKVYLDFCKELGCSPFPASNENLCRYAAYLSRTRAFSTVQQYMNVIRIAHLELGLPNPLKENWNLKTLLKGIQRGKAGMDYKFPISTEHLHKIKDTLNPHNVEDCQFWAAVVICFFGLLRISNVTVKSTSSWDESKILHRSDITLTPAGMILCIRWAKNLQFKDRVLEVPLPWLQGRRLCPTTAVGQFLALTGMVPEEAPLLSYSTPSGLRVLTQNALRKRLTSVLPNIGVDPKKYSTHSLRRGGATWLMSAGVPVSAIKVIGDWKSDCVYKYLCPNVMTKMKIIKDAALSLP